MKYDVWCPDLGSGPEDAMAFEAFDAEHAAAEWAYWEDGHSADYWIVGGQDAARITRLDTKQKNLVTGRFKQ